MSDVPPVSVMALFLDDARQEATGKNILIGQYLGEMYVSSAGPPVDRLTVAFLMRWPADYSPQSMQVWVDLPGQPTSKLPVPPPPTPPESAIPGPPFNQMNLQVIAQLRFAPLRVGDLIDAWLEVDGHEFPAGRLRVSELPTQSRTTSENISVLREPAATAA